MNASRIAMVAAVAVLAVSLAACAAGPNSAVHVADADGLIRGFWPGLWQGFISPITFLISLFTEKVTIYEVHNNGGWYDFGFVLGAGILFGGGFMGLFRPRWKK